MSERYNVTGMSCAACQMHVEKAVRKVAGVENVTVSLLTNSMTVEGCAEEQAIIKAVEHAGYGAFAADPTDHSQSKQEYGEAVLKDRETPLLLRRLFSSVFFLVILMYFSMGHMLWGFPIPQLLDNPVSLCLVEMLFTVIIMYINRKFFVSGFSAVGHGSATMDTLVAMGAGASFLYSLVVLFLISDSMSHNDMDRVMYLMSNHVYFESAAMILTLITIGKTLEAYSKGRTTDALKALMRLAPQTANIERDGKIIKADITEVRVGDIFVVKPGESIPVDGVITDGTTAVNEAALTGESVPVDKAEGDTVSAATINTSGYIKCRAVRVGSDTTLSQIIRLVSEAASSKAPIARIADRVSGIFCPAVIIISIFTLTGWLISGAGFYSAFAKAVTVLVISCPCALGLATPVAIMVGNGMGAKNGILYKTAVSLETAGRTDVIVMDKTGTITNGTPVVTDVISSQGAAEEHLLEIAAALEAKSEHPLSRAVLSFAENRNIRHETVTDFNVVPGRGLSAKLNSNMIYGGNPAYITDFVKIDDELKEQGRLLSGLGRTPLYFAENDHLLGLIAVADTLKEEAPSAIRQLRDMGIQVIMLTGDNKRTAEAIGNEAGVDEVIADVMPDEKEKVIQRLQRTGTVTMVGDGINDAPALTRADTGIAIGAGVDVAIDAADIVLVKSRVTDVPATIRLSRAVIRNIHENLFWAFFYNIICIPLAIGLYQILFHWDFEMKPVIGALAMSFSSVTVCLNALRLNLFRLYDPSHDKKSLRRKKEAYMKKIIRINGMMCEHCEMSVKKALEAINGVVSAEVSHKSGTAEVELKEDVDNSILKSAVEAKDYEVIGIE